MDVFNKPFASSGVPGDTKFVAFQTLDEALTNNPGWAVFGAGNQELRGRLDGDANHERLRVDLHRLLQGREEIVLAGREGGRADGEPFDGRDGDADRYVVWIPW